LTETLLEAG